MRFTKNVFTNLAISMVGFGILIGILFPFFSLAMGVEVCIALSPLYFTLCIIAGVIVGAVNILLARVTVRKQLKKLSGSMKSAKVHLDEIMQDGKTATCSSSDCYLTVDTIDEFGESANAFNQLLHAFDESLRTENAFRDYNKTLTSDLKLDSLASNALKEILLYTRAAAGAIYAVKNGRLELAACDGIISADTLKKNHLILNVLKTKSLRQIDLPEDIIVDGLLASVRPKSIIIEPIIYKGAILGVIVLAGLTAFSNQTLKHLEVFSNSLALALNNSLEHTQLQTLVALDPLTNIYNRKFGLNRLAEEYSSSIRTAAPLGVMMFDIDHFKKVNDTFGHIAGDRVLVDIAHMSRATLRRHDILMRYGGEEFVAILPGASTHDTLVVADRLRELVQNSFVAYGDNRINVTVSIGIASYPETDVSKTEDLIKFADEALYRAKDSGRNRVVLYDETIIK